MRWFTLLVAAAFLLAGCSGSDNSTSATTTSGSGGITATGTASNTGNPTGGGGGGGGGGGSSGTSSSGTPAGGSMEISLSTLETSIAAQSTPTFTINATFKDEGGNVVTPPGVSWSVKSKRLKDEYGNDPQEPASEIATGPTLPSDFTFNAGSQGVVLLTAYVKADTFAEQSLDLELTITAPGPPPPPFYTGHFEDTVAFNVVISYAGGEHEPLFDETIKHPELNGTFLVWYHYTIPEGLEFIDWNTVGDATAVDCDLWVKGPDGSYTGGTNDGDCAENYHLDVPPAGEYYLIAELWTGGNAIITSDILIK